MSDILSAASLLLAIVAVVFGMWYEELVRALATEVPQHSAAKRKPKADVEGVRRTRSLPLMLVAAALAAVFLPEAVVIVLRSAAHLWRTGIGAIQDYDSVATSFVLVEGISIWFAVYFFKIWLKFGKLIGDLS